MQDLVQGEGQKLAFDQALVGELPVELGQVLLAAQGQALVPAPADSITNGLDLRLDLALAPVQDRFPARIPRHRDSHRGSALRRHAHAIAEGDDPLDGRDDEVARDQVDVEAGVAVDVVDAAQAASSTGTG